MNSVVRVWDMGGRLVGTIDADRRVLPARGDFAGTVVATVDGIDVWIGGCIFGWVDGDKIMYMRPGMGAPIQAGRVDGTKIYSRNGLGDERLIGTTSTSDPPAAAAALIALKWA